MSKNFENLDYWMNWMETTPDIIFFKDLKGVYKGVSKSTALLAGFSCSDEMIGKTDLQIYDSDRANNFVKQDESVISTLKPLLVDDWIDHPTKGLMKIETLKAPLFDRNGVLIGVQGVSRDITEKSNYEKIIYNQRSQLTAIVDNIPFPIWLKDIEGNYLIVNKSYEEFYGIKKECLIGVKPQDVLVENSVFSPEEIQKMTDEDAKIINEKIVVNSATSISVCDKVYFLEITKAPVYDQDGNVIGVAGISIDVTSHKTYEDELTSARDLAQQANKTKSEFLANMSHEIRTPMNGIMGFIQLLSETELDDEQKDYVDEAKKSSEILLKLLNDILDLSKIEAGKMSMENISFNIRYVIEDVATLASSNAVKKGVEINALCYSNVPDKVLGDPGRLKQVLNNFVNNAIKFTQEGEIMITVKMLEKNEDRAKLLFEIQDTGIGISEENQSKIFEAFTQADSSTTRQYGGTGLGLTISKNIVNMMNGDVFLESKENKGSKFSFTVEFDLDKDETESQNEYKSIQGLNILLVDDNKTNLKVLSHYLKEYGVKTVETKGPKQAIEALKLSREKFDIVLTDYCMPGLDGIELTNAIHMMEQYSEVPVVLLTSRAQRGDYKLVKENNLRGYLPKPIRKNDLIECILMIVSQEKSEGEEKVIVTRHSIKEKHLREDLKILLVEDNRLNQKLATKMLSKAGYSCDLAQNGIEAIQALKENHYDIVLMDCQMPIMDGYEATAKIRENEKNEGLSRIPIIALTANAMHGDDKFCTDAGMDDYLAKPISYELLIEKIKTYTPSKKGIINLQKFDVATAEIDESAQKELISEIVRVLGIDKSDAIELLQGFVADAGKNIDEIEDAFIECDFEKVASLAHSMKGASGNLRILKIYELTTEIEKRAKSQDAKKISELIEDLKNEFFGLLI